MHLSKSDFKACVDCPTRLHYRKAKDKYPSAKDDNEYLQFLADGGFMVEFLAKARFHRHVDLVDIRDPAEAFAKTKTALQNDGAIFEAAVNSGPFHARTDILVKEGKTLRLIEVKSSSVKTGEEEHEEDDSENEAKGEFLTKKEPRRVAAKWLPYLQDLTFQTIVLEMAFPEYTVRPFLAVIDKSQVATEAETLDKFTLTMTATAGKRPRPEVTYKGDVAQLQGSKLIVTLDAREAVENLRASVSESAKHLAGLLDADGARWEKPDLGGKYRECKDCEYRTEPTTPDKPSGFSICWKEFPITTSHILDLYFMGQIGTGPKDPIPALLARGSASYLDLPRDQLGNPGPRQTRRLIQWNGTRDQKAWQDPNLGKTLKSHAQSPGYPFHFIDFEACNISLPHHAGLHPYERVTFQWSCHTVASDGKVRHQGWLNDERAFPNFEFARTLRKCIWDQGTVYVWSNYEQVTLNKVLEQLRAAEARGLGSFDPELAQWLEALLGPPDDKGKRHASPRIRDLHDLTQAYYFHPAMKGRTSIKVVLPAVWKSDKDLRAHPCFKDYLLVKGEEILDPYKALPSLPLGTDSAAVREGTGAVRIYQDLIFNVNVADRENRRKLLWQYCQLDTAAMLMIWMHWLGRYDLTVL